MKLNRSLRILLFVGIQLSSAVSLPQIALTQPAGSPIFTRTHREFTLAFNSGFSSTDIYGVTNRSTRFLFKGIYGLGNFLDLFAEVGLAKLNLATSETPRPKFKDNFHIAIGGGFTVRYIDIKSPRMSLFFGGQIFRFTSRPTSKKNLVLGGSGVTQVVELDYDWREVIINTGFAHRKGSFNVYSGLNAKIIHRLEKKTARNIISGNVNTGNIQQGEYQSGVQINPFIGIDMMLPSRYLVSLEFIGRGKSHLILSLGISQTGKP